MNSIIIRPLKSNALGISVWGTLFLGGNLPCFPPPQVTLSGGWIHWWVSGNGQLVKGRWGSKNECWPWAKDLVFWYVYSAFGCIWYSSVCIWYLGNGPRRGSSTHELAMSRGASEELWGVGGSTRSPPVPPLIGCVYLIVVCVYLVFEQWPACQLRG